MAKYRPAAARLESVPNSSRSISWLEQVAIQAAREAIAGETVVGMGAVLGLEARVQAVETLSACKR